MSNKYSEKGFAIIEKLFTKEEMSDLVFDIHKIFSAKLTSRGFKFKTTNNGFVETQALFKFFESYNEEYISCMRAVQNLIKIYELGISTRLLDEVRKLGLKFPAFSTPPLTMLNHQKLASNEGYWKTPAHQDWRSIQGSLNCVIAWIPLVDVNKELGSVEIIPCSHKKGLLPSEFDEWYAHVKEDAISTENFISVPMRAGDVVIFSAFLVHRSGINSSNEIRYSLQFRYNDLSEPTFVQRGYPNPYTSVRPQKELITPNFPKTEDIQKTFKSIQ